ncbi:hypothetical protein [Sulfuricurvum sp.]|uniref:hypothetical protein n=1 Tax=Sulfuricurvum sp. TaxID=2025608 RepID=UPI002631B304|nr:hypothetical protein [Sulfuricurvum sp.]MDD2267365.1 hypothetical protein [Sulfuricurvum sp.]
MPRSKLTPDLIYNSFDFYNQNLGQVFSESEQTNLSNKLLNIIKYDHILRGGSLLYNLPQYTLTIIYFIGEYKKAYQYASQHKKDKKNNTLEALDKGYPRKEKAYKENKKKLNDESLAHEDRLEAFYKTIIFLLLKKKNYNKVSMLLLASLYAQLPILKMIFTNVDKFNKLIQLVLQALEDALQTLEYTYLSKDKVLNSSVIMIYTILASAVKLDEKDAFKYTKDLVYSFIDNSAELTDKYRKDLLTDKEIYCAGMYNGLPIYTWYTGQDESYYNDEDFKKIDVILRVISNSKEMALVEKDVSLNMLKLFDKDASLTDIEKMTNKDEIIKWIKTSYKQSAIMPFSLFQYITKPRKSIFIFIKALIYALITKFSELKTKFTKK